MNLEGLRVLNTRPIKQALGLTQAVVALKGTVIECPGLAIEPLSLEWKASLPSLSLIDKVIFTSANAVDYFFQGLADATIIFPKKLKVFAIGQATAQAFNQFFPDLEIHAIPLVADSQHLIGLPDLTQLRHQRVLLVKGLGGLTLIAEHLQAQGCDFKIIEVYKRLLPTLDVNYIESIWQKDAVDIILFTSQELMDNIFRLFGVKAYVWLVNKPCLVISHRLLKAASDKGIKKIFQCRPDAIISQLLQFNQELNHGLA